MSPATLLVLTVRLYAATMIGERDLGVARREAQEILAGSGVAITWVDCSPRNGVALLCTQPLRDDELAFRFMNAVDSRVDGPLGESLVETSDGGGALATLFPNRIARLAASARVPIGMVVGRALAHEIGHLILGASAHRSSGVMRPAWTVMALRARTARDWQFSPEQAADLRARVAIRITSNHEHAADAFEPSTFSLARTEAVGLSLAP